MFIRIEKNADGSHAYQIGGYLEDGWAAVPDGLVLPDSFPFVDIEVEEVFHAAITTKKVNANGVEETVELIPACSRLEVVKMTESEEIAVSENVAPTQMDRIEAQVTYTAMMTDTLLEV